MTDLATAPRVRPDVATASPPADRLTRPRWRDGRFVIGVVLVLVSVLLGARLLSGQRQSTSVLVAARALSQGHVIEAGDVHAATLRLSGVAGRYWAGADADALVGHRLTSSVGQGDLLPRSAVSGPQAVQPHRVLSVPVEPGRLPELSPGDRVDLFATYKATAQTAGRTVAVLTGAEYVGAGDAGSSAQVAIRLRVPVDAAHTVVRASQVAALDVVLQEAAGAVR